MMRRFDRRRWGLLAAVAVMLALLAPQSRPVGSFASGGSPAAPLTPPRLHGFGSLPLAFEANHGQFAPRVRFVTHAGNETLVLTAQDAVFSLATGRASRAAVRVHMVGARQTQPRGVDRLPGRMNYLLGRHRWTNIPTYSQVVYPTLYPHTDLVYHGTGGHLDYDWVLKPGASVSAIDLRIAGPTSIHVDARGNLILGAHGAVLREGAPLAYQHTSAGRVAVAARYVLAGPHDVRLALGPYDRSTPLIIDPPVLAFSTYLGGGGGGTTDQAMAITRDTAGNLYITGWTESGSPPDIFITKIDPTGTHVLYSTIVGGSGDDEGNGIAVDAAGAAYVTGFSTSTDFPGPGSSTPTASGQKDIVAIKLDPSGASLTYADLLGSPTDDVGEAIAVDGAGNAYITGQVGSDAILALITGNGTVSAVNSILALYATTNIGYGIALDSSDNIWIAGKETASTGAGVSGFHGGSSDAFVAEFTAHTVRRQYITFLGGSGLDLASAIAIDRSDNIYVAGVSQSPDFPTANFYEMCNSSATRAFIVKLNPSATGIIYSTCLGGMHNDGAMGLAVDGAGEAIVGGVTTSTDFPVINPIEDTFSGFPFEGFVAKLNAEGNNLLYSTYLGGNGFTAVRGVAADAAGNAYVTGATSSTDFPTAPSGDVLQPMIHGNSDGFVAEIQDPTFTSPTPTSTPTTTSTATAAATATETSVPTATETSVPTATETAIPTATETATSVPTATVTATPTATETPTRVPPPASPTIALKPSGKITAGSKLKITVSTLPHATVKVTLRVKKSKMTLYELTLTGTAKASGTFSRSRTITYLPPSKAKLKITVTVTTAGGNAVTSTSITIVPKT